MWDQSGFRLAQVQTGLKKRTLGQILFINQQTKGVLTLHSVTVLRCTQDSNFKPDTHTHTHTHTHTKHAYISYTKGVVGIIPIHTYRYNSFWSQPATSELSTLKMEKRPSLGSPDQSPSLPSRTYALPVLPIPIYRIPEGMVFMWQQLLQKMLNYIHCTIIRFIHFSNMVHLFCH